jgi:hypothetical protein
MKSVYSAVRTGALNKAVCGSALEGSKHVGDKPEIQNLSRAKWEVREI